MNAMRRPARGDTAAVQDGARPIRIALFGLFGCGNFGNDGSLEAMLDHLRQSRPDAELSCICHDPEVVRQAFRIDTLPINVSRRLQAVRYPAVRRLMKIPGRVADFWHSLKVMRRFDIMVIPGTGILDDFGERPWGMPLDIFRWCLAARFSRVHIAMVSIGAGPIGNGASRRLMIGAARLAQYRSYRDQFSKDFMLGAGLDACEDPVYPDIAFKLPTPTASAPAERPGGRLLVGVGVMAYRGWYGFDRNGDDIKGQYLDRLADFVSYLLSAGHDIRLLTGENTDRLAIADLLELLRRRHGDVFEARISCEPANSLHDLMRQMRDIDVVVATRFHNIVCALKLGKPTVSLGYSKKNDVLMRDAGLAEFCQHVEQFDVGLLVGQFERLVSSRDALSRLILQRVDQFRARLAEQDDRLAVDQDRWHEKGHADRLGKPMRDPPDMVLDDRLKGSGNIRV